LRGKLPTGACFKVFYLNDVSERHETRVISQVAATVLDSKDINGLLANEDTAGITDI
jgi:hypothetical protein